ncbi:Transposase, IS204/IS1001/IS1096/IS1165, partial [mine drainage metagenome]
AVMKGHNYETVFYDHKERRVIHTEMGKKNTVFRKLKKVLPEPEKVKNVSMDMTKWYILGLTKYFPGSQIVFDHFHVIKGMNDVVDRVRRMEQKENSLLKNTNTMTLREKKRFKTIKHLDLKTPKSIPPSHCNAEAVDHPKEHG